MLISGSWRTPSGDIHEGGGTFDEMRTDFESPIPCNIHVDEHRDLAVIQASAPLPDVIPATPARRRYHQNR